MPPFGAALVSVAQLLFSTSHLYWFKSTADVKWGLKKTLQSCMISLQLVSFNILKLVSIFNQFILMK